MEQESSEMDEYVSPAQLDEQLVTLSLLPDSRWKNLLHLDIIKVCALLTCSPGYPNIVLVTINIHFFMPQKRNKPKEPPKVPKAAPFFIPTVPGLVPQFALPDTSAEDQVTTQLLHSYFS